MYLRPGALARFFQLCEQYGTYLSQPALNWFTHTTLNVLVRNPACVMRRLSFVEVMAPCFSARPWKNCCRPLTGRAAPGARISPGVACSRADTRSTWLMRSAWTTHAPAMDDPRAFYRKLTAMGVDPAEELRAILARFPNFGGQRMLKQGTFTGRVCRPRWSGAAGCFLKNLKSSSASANRCCVTCVHGAPHGRIAANRF